MRQLVPEVLLQGLVALRAHSLARDLEVESQFVLRPPIAQILDEVLLSAVAPRAGSDQDSRHAPISEGGFSGSRGRSCSTGRKWGKMTRMA